MVRRHECEAGVTLVEVLVACALIACLGAAAGAAVPGALAQARVRNAAVFLTAELERARVLALARSAAVGVYFGPPGEPAAIGIYADGNGNGLRTAEVQSGTDPVLVRPRPLHALFPGVSLSEGADEGVRLGGSRLLTFTPAGTATSGSLYLTGQDGTRYALRISGATARIRRQRFNATSRLWSDR